MKAIMISVKPKYVADILNGRKTIEIRKTCPARFKNLKPYECANPIDVYIYCTKDNVETLFKSREQLGKEYYDYVCLSKKGKDYNLFLNDINLNGKVVAKFTLNKVEEIETRQDRYKEFVFYEILFDVSDLLKKSCLDYYELDNYLCGEKGYAWHISNLEIFDEPQELEKYMHIKNYFLGRTYVPQSWCYIEVDYE